MFEPSRKINQEEIQVITSDLPINSLDCLDQVQSPNIQIIMITSPEVVLKKKMDKYQPYELDATAEKYFQSLKPPVVIPDNPSVNHNRGNQN